MYVLGRVRSSWVAVAMGIAVLVAAATAAGAVGGRDAASAGSGTLRIGRGPDFQTLDTGLDYTAEGWQLEYATCARLYNYPDAPPPAGSNPIPEVASDFPTFSRDGRTITIALRRGFSFNTGERIAAANFVTAFNRDANPQLQTSTNPPQTSAAVAYMHEIIGADAVVDGKAAAISGVRALKPYTLQIRMTRRVPDLVYRLAMPLFCPVPADAPPRELELPPGSGPYFIASHVPNQRVVLNRNPHYGGNRHPHVRQIVYNLGVGGEACRIAVEQNQLDACTVPGIPGDDFRELAGKYGVNRKGGRFFANPTLATWFFAFNHQRPAFKGQGQIPLKQAINWAIDRHALAATRGFLGGKRTDQILPPAIGRPANIYPLGGGAEEREDARLARAQALAAKAKLQPKTLVLYTANVPAPTQQAQIFQYDLKRIGIDVEVKLFSPYELGLRAGTRGEPYDVYLWGWGADYPDPAGFFTPLLGSTITHSAGVNTAYYDRPRYNRLVDAANRLQGLARQAAFAKVDEDMMRNDPPWAPFLNQVARDFISQSFGCYLFQPGLSFIDLVAACKK